jgi:hypothetical protein
VGARLVEKAFACIAERDRVNAAPLTPNAKILLLWMAEKAMDNDPSPRYFGSRDLSAYGMGRFLDDLTPEPRRRSAYEIVRRATQELVQKGLIQRVKSGRQGQRAEFSFEFRVPPEDQQIVVPESNELLPLQHNKSLDPGTTNRWAQGTTDEPIQELDPGTTGADTQTISLAPVDKSELEAIA